MSKVHPEHENLPKLAKMKDTTKPCSGRDLTYRDCHAEIHFSSSAADMYRRVEVAAHSSGGQRRMDFVPGLGLGCCCSCFVGSRYCCGCHCYHGCYCCYCCSEHYCYSSSYLWSRSGDARICSSLYSRLGAGSGRDWNLLTSFSAAPRSIIKSADLTGHDDVGDRISDLS